MDVLIFIGKWFLVIAAINIISWTFFPNTMRELTKFEAEWRNYKLKKWARLKEKNGINNLWKEEQYKEWREEVKKHPEKVGKLHITEDSFTFEFNDKNNKN